MLQMERPQVFYTYEWALAVYRAYHATLHPMLFVAYDGHESLCGVAALAIETSGHRASFLCATTGDYCDFLSTPEQRESFVGAVLAELKQQNISEIVLANLPADSASVSAIRKTGDSQHYRCFARTGYICAQVLLASLERRGDAKPVLPRKKMLRRFLNAMGQQSPVRLNHARSWDAIETLLPDFIHMHVGRFLVTGRISNMARKERRDFLAELAKLLSETGWLVLTRMMSGSKVFAWNYGFQFHGTWFWYQPTFDSDEEKYSPGFCLLAKLIEEAADDSALQIVDLGLGAEEYKERFANQTQETLHVTLQASSIRHFREIARYNTAELIRTSSLAEQVVRTIMRRYARFREHLAKEGLSATLVWLARKFRQLLWLRTEVFFYEFGGAVPENIGSSQLQELNLNDLAIATSQNVDDPPTLDYLVRAASRLRRQEAEGYALVDAGGRLLHFAWATKFNGFFLSELNAKIEAPSADCVMLFDCWTPAAARGHGFYGQTIALIANDLEQKGKRPWVFSASSNMASIRGVQKAGFLRRYSLERQRFLGWQRVKSKPPATRELRAEEVSARV